MTKNKKFAAVKDTIIGIGALLLCVFVIGGMIGLSDYRHDTPNKPISQKLDRMCEHHGGTYEYKKGWGGAYDFSALCNDGEVFHSQNRY